jgi:hypothetical protein
MGVDAVCVDSDAETFWMAEEVVSSAPMPFIYIFLLIKQL